MKAKKTATEKMQESMRETAAIIGGPLDHVINGPKNRDGGPSNAELLADEAAALGVPVVEGATDRETMDAIADAQEAATTTEPATPEPTTADEAIAEACGESVVVAPPDAEPDDDAYFHSLTDLESECEAAESKWANAKERAKDAKKLYESAVLKLRKAVRDGNKPMPLFDAPKEPEKPAVIPTGADAAADPNSWRNCTISELNLPGTLDEKLAENGIETIGQLEDKRAAWGGLKSIKGIGQAKVDVIESAVIDWLTLNRDSAALAAAAAPSPECNETPTTSETTTIVAPLPDAPPILEPSAFDDI